MRVFAAVELDHATRRALARLVETAPLVGSGVHWVPCEQMHLTLRFVGEVEDARISAVTAAVQEATQGLPCFEMAVLGLGCFPTPEAPRVFWAGVSVGPELARLAGAIEQGLRARGFPPDHRRFRPHVTLARIRKRGVRPREAFEPGRPHFGTQEVAEVTVFESRLSRGKTEHLALARLPLGEDA